MGEILKESLLEAVFDMDQFFPAGYVIELGKNRYYRKYQDGKILCSAIAGAKRFLKREDAERFARRHLGYVDMEAYLCEVGWVLLSAESEVMDCDQYWNGRQFTSDREKARVFSSYQETSSYQKRNGLEAVSMIDQQVFRRAQFRVAA